MLETLRILLVEDDAADRALIAALLRQGLSSARIQEVNGALEFAEMLDGHRWSVTIAGGCLSWANGAELLRTVKQHHPECRTILFGRAPPEGLGTFGPGTGLDAYLRKDSTGFLELPALIREAVSTSTQATAERTYPLLRGGIEAAPIGYFWVLSDGTLLETNPAFGALVGETDPEALIGQSLLGWVNGTTSRTRIERSLLRGTREDLTDVPLRVAGSIERRCNRRSRPAEQVAERHDEDRRVVRRDEQPARRREVHRGDALERRREPAELARERRLRGGGGGDEDERVARGGEREVRRRARRVQDGRGRRLRRRERAVVSGARARKLRGEGGGCLRERREAVQLERWELWRRRLHERSE